MFEPARRQKEQILPSIPWIQFRGLSGFPRAALLGIAFFSIATFPAVAAGNAEAAAKLSPQKGPTAPLTTVKPVLLTVKLVGKAVVPPAPKTNPVTKPSLQIKLVNPDDLATTDTLLFSLKSAQPFPSTAQIEIASPNESLQTTLTIADQSLVLEDPQTILGRFDPLKAFGLSAFGPLRLRAVAPDGTAGEWLPLVTLVRLPTLTSLNCPAEHTSCTLTGADLYLIDAVSTDAAFTKPTRVPEGFVGTSLAVPAPTAAMYYLRLRDDPTAANTITLSTRSH